MAMHHVVLEYLSVFICLYNLERRSGKAGHKRDVLAGTMEVGEGDVGEEVEVGACAESGSPCPIPDTFLPLTCYTARCALKLDGASAWKCMLKRAFVLVNRPRGSARSWNRL
jgi:hypothetical protein